MCVFYAAIRFCLFAVILIAIYYFLFVCVVMLRGVQTSPFGNTYQYNNHAIAWPLLICIHVHEDCHSSSRVV